MKWSVVKATGLMAALGLLGGIGACDSGTDPDPRAAEVRLDARVDLLPAGQSIPLLVEVDDEEGNPILDPAVEFTSNDESVATVDDEGVLTGVGEGTATITASVDDVSGTASVFIAEFEEPCFEALPLFPDDPVRANLQQGDCDETFGDGSFTDVWWFELDEAADVTIAMTSEEVDAYLLVVDDQGGDRGEAGDPGTPLAVSLALFDLAPGTYFVIAGHWPLSEGGAGYTEPGVYTLELSVDPAVTAADAARPGPEASSVRRQSIRSTGIPGSLMRTTGPGR